jgi:hypothetical protein
VRQRLPVAQARDRLGCSAAVGAPRRGAHLAALPLAGVGFKLGARDDKTRRARYHGHLHTQARPRSVARAPASSGHGTTPCPALAVRFQLLSQGRDGPLACNQPWREPPAFVHQALWRLPHAARVPTRSRARVEESSGRTCCSSGVRTSTSTTPPPPSSLSRSCWAVTSGTCVALGLVP